MPPNVTAVAFIALQLTEQLMKVFAEVLENVNGDKKELFVALNIPEEQVEAVVDAPLLLNGESLIVSTPALE